MNFEYGSQDKSERIKGVLIVIAIHVLLVYAVASGLTLKGIDMIKIPLEMVMVKEIAPPLLLPPPPAQEIKLPEINVPRLDIPPPPLQIETPPPTLVKPVLATAPVRQAPPTMPTPPPVMAVMPTPPLAPPVDNARAPVASLEAEYTGRVRNMLNAAKRYPTSREARQLRPKGTVKVWLEIDRAGQMLGAGIEASAGTLLLDNEALRTVRNVQYPAFPAEAFVGQASRRFIVSIEYQAAEGS